MLQAAKANDAKSFWFIVAHRGCTNSTRPEVEIQSSEWVDHFKSLNSGPVENPSSGRAIDSTHESATSRLVTVLIVLLLNPEKMIQTLKLGKTPGLDKILVDLF